MTPRQENGLGSLYDYGARFYSPVLGRFLSADTVVPSPADPQQLNRYSYTRNNPIKYIDPTGHYIFEEQPGDRIPIPGTKTSLPNYFVPLPDARRLYGVNTPIRESVDTYNKENGHQPTTWEYVGTMLGVPAIAAFFGLGGGEILSWLDTADSLIHQAQQRTVGNSGIYESGIPDGYSPAEWAARREVVRNSGGKYYCNVCARRMNRQFGDAVVAITTDEGPLLGPAGSDIGAPEGWHMMTIDRLGNAWDNLGFKGDASDFLGRMVEANPSGVNSSVSSRFFDAWRWLDAGGH